MRFLIGIFTGAVVTLLVATAMDAPTHPLLTKAKDVAATGWDRLIHATSSSLFEGEEAAVPATVPTPTPEAEPDDEPTAPAERPARDPERSKPLAAESAPVSGASEVPDTTAAMPDLADEAAAYAALEPVPALPAPAPVEQPPASGFWVETALALERSAHANQPVWVPFHSQMSAQGFASRLSRALDHEFRVVRQGAGAYQVVFDASNADEHALIMAQITELTGQ